MKLLFDQNLSRKLVSRLADIFPNSSHVQFYKRYSCGFQLPWDFKNHFRLPTSAIFPQWPRSDNV
ncbi:DUF5615 family PIN-like protein [Crocosphaera sp. UHCC 0190]|uniref:DUF5615 family PIN-like protein n=1 Tax=Crocosphaera sp. UHCC 0190 TaxID=3110246 RepID=UPI002B20F1A5|nr:DUF5615 family PIN-like protein [Crocosphaera sp. UHCC 0190]MEA5508620.1 DUF5615 family PIN-like protein [Crocosphaera sp. UHCC 0190]